MKEFYHDIDLAGIYCSSGRVTGENSPFLRITSPSVLALGVVSPNTNRSSVSYIVGCSTLFAFLCLLVHSQAWHIS